MSRIRGKDTRPELILRKALWKKGARYRMKNRLPGRPDLIFPGRKLAVFVDGCFWHKCPDHYQSPKKNAKFWREKIEGNVERDNCNTKKLIQNGWRVIRVWEHDIRQNLPDVVQTIMKALATGVAT